MTNINRVNYVNYVLNRNNITYYEFIHVPRWGGAVHSSPPPFLRKATTDLGTIVPIIILKIILKNKKLILK